MIKDIMFIADGYDVAWSDIANGWMLEHPDNGHIRTYPNLIRALSELERVSGVGVDAFTWAPNPYGRD